MGKSKKSTSDLIRGGNKFVSIMSKICTAVDEAGGSDDDVASLDEDTPGAKWRLGQIAKMLRNRVADDKREALVAKAMGLLSWPASTYFIPLSDADVPEQYQATLAKYRRLATDHDVPATTAVCYKVKAGFTLKTHAPKLGPCYKNYEYLQDWDFPDEATEDCLVFWVPRVINTSYGKYDQILLLAKFRTEFELPGNHMSGLGKVSLVAGLILANYKATGERITFDEYVVRTDTCLANRDRLLLGRFSGHGLRCESFHYDAACRTNIGVLALGVEKL